MKRYTLQIVATVLIGMPLMTPALAAAQSTTTAQEQILTLMQQIKALQQQLSALMQQARQNASTTKPWMDGNGSSTRPMMGDGCPTFARELKRGASGDDVRELQQQLQQAMPEEMTDDKITGFFGGATEKALKKFQKMRGMASSTGVFGPVTRGEMGKHCGELLGKKMGQMEMKGSSTEKWGDKMHDMMERFGSTTDREHDRGPRGPRDGRDGGDDH